MKKNVTLKILIVLIIIAISLISFVGIYTKDKTQMVNVLPKYLLSMNLSGSREVILQPTDDTEEITYDAEGNVTEDGLDEEGNLKEGYVIKDEKINRDDILNEENFRTSKSVLEKRLEKLGVEDYTLRQDISTGAMTVNLPEDSNVDTIISNLTHKGKFEILDSDTQEVLMNNSDVKDANVVYQDNGGITVFLNIEFNKDGKKKLEEITKTYIATTDEEGNQTTKKIQINLDDQQLLQTYFAETLTTGELPLTVGQTTTDTELVDSYMEQAQQVASVISNNKMEIQYEITSNLNVSPIIGENEFQTIIVWIIAIVAIALVVLCIRFRTNGILASISYIGEIALLLLVLRYTNVIISFEGILGIIVILIANYAFLNYILTKFKKNEETSDVQLIKESFIHYIWILLPLLLISIVFTFMKYTPISSIGMIMFWGLSLIFVYNYLVTATLLKK